MGFEYIIHGFNMTTINLTGPAERPVKIWCLPSTCLQGPSCRNDLWNFRADMCHTQYMPYVCAICAMEVMYIICNADGPLFGWVERMIRKRRSHGKAPPWNSCINMWDFRISTKNLKDNQDSGRSATSPVEWGMDHSRPLGSNGPHAYWLIGG